MKIAVYKFVSMFFVSWLAAIFVTRCRYSLLQTTSDSAFYQRIEQHAWGGSHLSLHEQRTARIISYNNHPCIQMSSGTQICSEVGRLQLATLSATPKLTIPPSALCVAIFIWVLPLSTHQLHSFSPRK